MMRRIGFLLFVMVAIAARGDDFQMTMSNVEGAFVADDDAALRGSIEQLKAMPSASRTGYAIAYTEWRLAHMPSTPKADRLPLLTDASNRLKEAIQLDAKNAEAHALLASVYGSIISYNKMRGMDLGPQSSRELETAQSLEPNNPRILLLAGISALMTPAEWGGGIEKAEPLLRNAASIFRQEPADRPWPNWGRFDSHMWLGQMLDKSGKRDAAKAEYEAALAVSPKSSWAHAMLTRTQ